MKSFESAAVIFKGEFAHFVFFIREDDDLTVSQVFQVAYKCILAFKNFPWAEFFEVKYHSDCFVFVPTNENDHVGTDLAKICVQISQVWVVYVAYRRVLDDD